MFIFLNFFIRVRTAAAQSLPYLLDCAKIRGDNYILELWKYILPLLLSAIEGESESDVLAEMFTSLADCITTLGMNSLNEQQMESLIKVLDVHFNEHFERSKERQSKRDDEDYDDGVEEALNDEVSSVIGRFILQLTSVFVFYRMMMMFIF